MYFYTISDYSTPNYLFYKNSLKSRSPVVFGPSELHFHEPISSRCFRSHRSHHSRYSPHWEEMIERRKIQMESDYQNIFSGFIPVARSRCHRRKRFNNTSSPTYQINKAQGEDKKQALEMVFNMNGYSADEIDVNIERDGHILCVSGKKYPSSFNRRFLIDPSRIDVEKMDAVLSNGTLKITAPSKKSEKKCKSLKNLQIIDQPAVSASAVKNQDDDDGTEKSNNKTSQKKEEKDESDSDCDSKQKKIESLVSDQTNPMILLTNSLFGPVILTSFTNQSPNSFESAYHHKNITEHSATDENTDKTKNFELKIDVEGFDSDDIDVELEENGTLLRVAGKKKTTADSFDGKTKIGARYSSCAFCQTFRFEKEKFDGDKVEAILVDGVLIVSAPTKEEKTEVEAVKLNEKVEEAEKNKPMTPEEESDSTKVENDGSEKEEAVEEESDSTKVENDGSEKEEAVEEMATVSEASEETRENAEKVEITEDIPRDNKQAELEEVPIAEEVECEEAVSESEEQEFSKESAITEEFEMIESEEERKIGMRKEKESIAVVKGVLSKGRDGELTKSKDHNEDFEMIGSEL